MSLAVLADHMASKGRGPDSMLIHMSPREVQGLQALAMKNGGSLTINPETGLPEAGFLDKLLPTIIGAGISYFSGGTIDPMTAAAMVGGVETARTGDLGRGISAGLGAYGGASLTAGMTTAGSTAMAGEAGALAGADAAAYGASQGFSPEAIDVLKRQAIDEGAMQQGMSELTGKTTTGELLSKGAGVAKNDPMAYLKANAKPLMYAAGPAILAAASAQENMPKTVTQPGMIRPYSYNPYSGGFVGGNPYEAQMKSAAGGGLMGMNNGGYDPGQLDFTQKSEPVVRMASGGIAGYAGNTGSVTDSGGWDYSKFNPANYAGKGTVSTQAEVDAARAAQEADNARQRTVTAQRVAAPDQEAAVLNALRIGQGLNTNTGVDANAGTVANANAGTGLASLNANTNVLTNTNTNALTNQGANSGLAGLNQNQNLLTNQDQNKNLNANAGLAALDPGASYTNRFFAERGLGFDPIDKAIDGFLATYKNQLAAMTPKQQEDAMRSALNVERMNEADVIKATGMTIAQLAAAKRADGSLIVPGKLDEVPVGSLPGGVSGAGNTVVNANGTITTKPDFDLTMNEVRNDYTKGGGSLGYTSPTFDSLKAVEDKYPLTGGSQQSYDFLMGRKDYDPVPYTKTGEVMKPYVESVLGKKLPTSSKMYLFDPETKTYKINPDYAIPTYDSKGVKSTNLTNKDVTAYMDKNPSQSDFYTWATTNNLSVDQIAAATGRPISEISKLYTGAKALTGEDGKIDQTKVDEKAAEDEKTNFDHVAYLKANPDVQAELDAGKANFGTKEDLAAAAYEHYQRYGKAGGRKYIKKAKEGGLMAMARGGMAQQFNLGDYSDGGRLLRGPGDGVSDSIPASIGGKRPARLADGEFVVPARIVSELGNGSTEAGARKLYAMMDRIQSARRGTVGRGRVAKNSRADKYLPA
jgi:hypothetical protein